MGSEHNPDNIQEQREDRIVDAAIALAEEVGWENVRLRIVAERLGVSLTEISSHFRDLDAVADAWFARARQEMLVPCRRSSPACRLVSDWRRCCCAGSMLRPPTGASAC